MQPFYVQLSIVALVLICGLAIVKGAPAERTAAVLILVTWSASLIAAVSRSHNSIPATVYLGSDAVLAAGLLLLAVLYSNWWMGAAMLLQAVGLSLHAAYFAADSSELSREDRKLYILGKNLASIAMLLVLLAATVATILYRRRAKGLAKTAAAALPDQAVPL